MNSPLWAVSLAIGVMLTVSVADGYQFRTHEKITGLAFQKSEGLRAYLESVGIQPGKRFAVHTRTPRSLLAEFNNDGTPSDWMIEGVIREDDYKVHPFLETALGCRPPDNPFSAIDRPLNHFLNVQAGGGGLSVPPFASGVPAVDWALGKQAQGTGGNEYSLPDARSHQFRSLTARSRSERELSAAMLFRTLGHVIHLLQDVAQPQHTRNDAHSGCVEPIGGHSSWFEEYIETRALGRRFRTRGDSSRALRLDGHSPPQFNSYEAYWNDPKGLASVSSRNFFSAGTNLSLLHGMCGRLSAPPCSQFSYEPRIESVPVYSIRGRSMRGWVQVFYHRMADPVTGDNPPVAVTSRSFWDQHLEEKGLLPVFTLNTINYDSMADQLIPRAVSYSAGLLDRFFRANVGADVDFDGVNIYNSTSGETAAGHFSLLHENPDGIRELLGVFPLTIEAEGHVRVGIPRKLPADTPPGTRCWLVFQGTLGDEPNVVAGRETNCPIETPPPIQGTEWWIYTCVILRFIPGNPAGAPPEYYTYATQGPPTYPEGDPVAQFNVGFYTTCSRTGSVSWGAAGPPPDIYREHPDV